MTVPSPLVNSLEASARVTLFSIFPADEAVSAAWTNRTDGREKKATSRARGEAHGRSQKSEGRSGGGADSSATAARRESVLEGWAAE